MGNLRLFLGSSWYMSLSTWYEKTQEDLRIGVACWSGQCQDAVMGSIAQPSYEPTHSCSQGRGRGPLLCLSDWLRIWFYGVQKFFESHSLKELKNPGAGPSDLAGTLPAKWKGCRMSVGISLLSWIFRATACLGVTREESGWHSQWGSSIATWNRTKGEPRSLQPESSLSEQRRVNVWGWVIKLLQLRNLGGCDLNYFLLISGCRLWWVCAGVVLLFWPWSDSPFICTTFAMEAQGRTSKGSLWLFWEIRVRPEH